VSGVSAYERVLVASPAFLDRGWLPPENDCAELADLRKDHQRLLDACGDALSQVHEAKYAVETAGGMRSDALRDAILAGESPSSVELPEPDLTAVEAAGRVYAAATEVLESFIGSALEQIAARAPEVQRGLAALQQKADAKRAEARRLLDEADRLDARPRRLANWISRYTGESVLGPIAYEALDAPMRVPVPPLFDEIAGLPPATVVGVGSDDLTPEELEAMSHAH
jgi:hypothetical protein